MWEYWRPEEQQEPEQPEQTPVAEAVREAWPLPVVGVPDVPQGWEW